MSTEATSKELRLSLWIVLIILACVVFVHEFEICPSEEKCGSIMEKFSSLSLNEMGDTLAGVFSPLAFSVAMIALLLQSKELRLSREQTTKTALALSKQTEILLKDAEERKNQNRYNYTIERLNILRQIITEGAFEYRGGPWESGEYYSLLIEMGKDKIFNEDSDAVFFTRFRMKLEREMTVIQLLFKTGQLDGLPSKGTLENFITGLEVIIEDTSILAPIHDLKLSHYKLPLVLEKLQKLLELELYSQVDTAS